MPTPFAPDFFALASTCFGRYLTIPDVSRATNQHEITASGSFVRKVLVTPEILRA